MTASRKTKALLSIIALGAVAGSLMAQRGPRPGGPPPDPATMVQNQVTHLTALLTLTPAQAAQATTIFTNAMTASSSLQTTMDSDRQNLESAINTNSTSVIDQISQNIGILNGQLTAIRAKADAAFLALLTPAQKATLEAAGGLGGPGPGGPGGPGGRGPGGPPPGRF